MKYFDFVLKGFFLSKEFSHLYPSETIVKLNIVIILGLGPNCFFHQWKFSRQKDKSTSCCWHLFASCIAAIWGYRVSNTIPVFHYQLYWTAYATWTIGNEYD